MARALNDNPFARYDSGPVLGNWHPAANLYACRDRGQTVAAARGQNPTGQCVLRPNYLGGPGDQRSEQVRSTKGRSVMRQRSLRHLISAAAIALASTTAVAACGSASARALPQPQSTVSPSAPAPSTPAPISATPSTAAPTTSTPRTTHSSTSPPTCLGAVQYTINTWDGRRWPTLCITVGGLLLLAGTGPGNLDSSPPGLDTCKYEGGTHACRLIATGTVKFTIRKPQGDRSLTVVVVGASSPPKPSPACLAASTVFRMESSGYPYIAECMKVGATVQITMLGPDDPVFSVKPSDMVACVYEGGSHECRLVKAGTVTFTFEGPFNSFTVVAIN
jgi:hypothetical protein